MQSSTPSSPPPTDPNIEELPLCSQHLFLYSSPLGEHSKTHTLPFCSAPTLLWWLLWGSPTCQMEPCCDTVQPRFRFPFAPCCSPPSPNSLTQAVLPQLPLLWEEDRGTLSCLSGCGIALSCTEHSQTNVLRPTTTSDTFSTDSFTQHLQSGILLDSHIYLTQADFLNIRRHISVQELLPAKFLILPPIQLSSTEEVLHYGPY